MTSNKDFESSLFNATKLEIRGGDALSRLVILLIARVLLAVIFIARLLLFSKNGDEAIAVFSNESFWVGGGYLLFHGVLWGLLKWTKVVLFLEIRWVVYSVLLVDVIAYSIPLVTAWYDPRDWVLLFGLTAITAGMFLRRRSALMFMSGVVLLLISPTIYPFSDTHLTRLVFNAYAGIGFLVVAFAVNELMQRTLRAEHKAKKNEELKIRTQRNQEIALALLPSGLLVLGKNYCVEHINPAARHLLCFDRCLDEQQNFSLNELPGGNEIYQWLLTQQTQELTQPDELVMESTDGKHLRLHLIAQCDEIGIVRLIMVEDLNLIEQEIQQQKLVSMGKLVASVAHEIRNPLAAIKNAAQLLSENENIARNQRLIELILLNSDRIGTTVTDILDLGRKNSVQRTPIQLLDAVSDVMDNLKIVPARMSVHIADSSAKVMFDAEHLNRILINLLTNAMRYASTHVNAIVLTTEIQKQQVKRLKISNDGPPIETHVLSRLFEPFSSTRVDGAGFGLYICNELCRRNGAKISHQFEKTAAGIRTCFVIDFT